MSRYKKLTISDGAKFMQHVWNFIFKPISEGEFFVEPWESRELADCAEFRLDNTKNLPSEILFFVNDEKLIHFLLSTREELYLFGANGQMQVCQMRLKGIVTSEETHPETDVIRECLRTRISKRILANISKISEQEAQNRFKILDHGKLFSFHPTEYAHASYDRG